MNCNFLSIDGTQLPGVNGITVEHITFRSIARALSGQLRVSRLGNAGASAAWVVNLNALSDAQKEFVLYHVLRDTGIRSVKLFNTAPFDAVVTVTTDNYVPRWDASGTVMQHASGRLVLRVEAVGAAPLSLGGIFAELVNDQFVFRDGLVNIPSTFTRASQAWDGTGLVPPDTMRVFGRDTKSPVVLIEGQQTNLISNSERVFSRTVGTGIESVEAQAPDGSMNATEIIVTADGLAPQRIHSLDSVSSVLTLTLNIKAGGADELRVGLYDGSSWGTDASVEILSGPGLVDSATGLVHISGLSATEWTRLRLTREDLNGDNRSFRVYPGPPGNQSTGDSVIFWRAQIEEAPFASSYIPTDGAPATRADDQLTVGCVMPAAGPFTIHSGCHGREEVTTQVGVWNLGSTSVGGNHFLRLVVTVGNNLILQLFEAGSYVSGVTVGAQPFGAYVVTVAVDDTNLASVYVNGQLEATLPISWTSASALGYDVLRVGRSAIVSQPLQSVIAPGASALGIPFIDNRAWSAAEIQAAHARWLPELNKIEVPV